MSLKPSWLIASVLVWVFLVAITSGCAPTASAPTRFGEGLPVATATPAVHNLERLMFERVNRDRAKNQLSALKYDAQLADIARSHSTDMHEHQFFEHDSPRFGLLEARLHRAGYLFRTARENLAEAPTVDDSEDGLLKSPHHYENLMASDITHIGIGIVQGGVKDPRNLTVTQIFATPGKHENDTEARHSLESVFLQARQRAGVPKLPSHPRLDQMAKEQLATLTSDPSPSSLKQVGSRVAATLAKSPIEGMARISVGAQVIVDSSQFTVDGAILSATAKYYGLAIDHSPDAKTPKLRVLLLIGLR